ncbi:MAG: hypothetical protein RR678_04020 [Lachnospiraceae bacterium]
MRKGTIPDLNSFASLALNIASVVDERGERHESFIEDLGLGYRVISHRLRAGVKSIADIQEQLAVANEHANIAEIGEKEANDFLLELFGDKEPYTLHEKYKARIKFCVDEILKEIEEEHE